MAPRYFYIPFIFVFTPLLTMVIDDIFGNITRTIVTKMFTLLIIVGYIICFLQTSESFIEAYRDPVPLWNRTIEIRGYDYHEDPWYNMGVALCFDGRIDEGINAYKHSLSIRLQPTVHYNLGLQLQKKELLHSAIFQY